MSGIVIVLKMLESECVFLGLSKFLLAHRKILRLDFKELYYFGGSLDSLHIN